MSDLPVPSTPRGGAARNARGSVGAECDEAATEAAAGIACIESQNALLASIEARLAIDLDQAPSNLSVQLSDDPSRHLSVDSLERYIERTGDLVPIYFLVEKYIKPRDGRQEAALAQLPALAEQLQQMLKQAGMA